MIKLPEIAAIQMGFSFRSGIEHQRAGDVSIIQMRDLPDNNRFEDSRNLMTTDKSGISGDYLVRRNDLIFRSRGKTATAVIVNTEINQTIVVAPLLRIRINDQNVLPQYLCWFINQPASQAFLHSRATGTAMVLIGKSVLEDLMIHIPELEIQKQIITLATLLDREEKLIGELAQKRKRMIGTILMQLAKGTETNFNPLGV